MVFIKPLPGEFSKLNWPRYAFPIVEMCMRFMYVVQCKSLKCVLAGEMSTTEVPMASYPEFPLILAGTLFWGLKSCYSQTSLPHQCHSNEYMYSSNSESKGALGGNQKAPTRTQRGNFRLRTNLDFYATFSIWKLSLCTGLLIQPSLKPL